jgi:biotin carboxyl carrier protein
MLKVQINNSEAKVFENEILKDLEAQFDCQHIGDNNYSIIQNEKSHLIEIQEVDAEAKIVYLKINGKKAEVKVSNDIDLLLEKMGIDMSSSQKMNELKAPMPGLVVNFLVEIGQEVQIGDKLMILEAMKMENVIKASGQGIVKKINVIKGQSVEKSQILIEFE